MQFSAFFLTILSLFTIALAVPVSDAEWELVHAKQPATRSIHVVQPRAPGPALPSGIGKRHASKAHSKTKRDPVFNPFPSGVTKRSAEKRAHIARDAAPAPVPVPAAVPLPDVPLENVLEA